MTSNPSPATPGSPPPGSAPSPPAGAPPAGGTAPLPGEDQGGGWLESLKDGRVSYAFIAAALLIFAMSQKGGFSLRGGVDPDLAVKYGAFHWPLVRDQGEWWRYVTTLFVARMGLDLVIFGFIFLQIGPQLERALGSLRFAVLYLLAGAGGVALAELMYGDTRTHGGMGDTIVACYAAFGALPGVILGATRSLRKTVQSPEAQSGAISIAFWTFLAYYITGTLQWSIVGAAVLGLLLGAGLMITREDKGKGLLASLVPLGLIVALIAMAASGKRWQDGKLTDRGRPATGRLPRGPATTTEPPASVLEPVESSNEKVNELREELEPFLKRFGPLPPSEGYTTTDHEEARKHLAAVEKVVNGTNTVLGELDPERIKLNIMLGNYSMAARIASDYLGLKPGPYARALAGVACFYLGGSALDRAEDHLEQATRDKKFTVEVPEAVYYYAKVLDERHGIDTAHSQYKDYLRLVADGPHPPWRKRLVDDARSRAP